MKKIVIAVAAVFAHMLVNAQTETDAGNWKPWFITSGKEYRLPAPLSFEKEIDKVISVQKKYGTLLQENRLFIGMRVLRVIAGSN
jgi:hypothetical protein